MSKMKRLFLQAVHILELVLQRYGSYEVFERVTGGSVLPKSRIWHSVKKYMEKEGCVGEVGPPRPRPSPSPSPSSPNRQQIAVTSPSHCCGPHWNWGDVSV